MIVVDRLSSSEWPSIHPKYQRALPPVHECFPYEIELQQLCYEIQNEAVAAQVAPSCLIVEPKLLQARSLRSSKRCTRRSTRGHLKPKPGRHQWRRGLVSAQIIAERVRCGKICTVDII